MLDKVTLFMLDGGGDIQRTVECGVREEWGAIARRALENDITVHSIVGIRSHVSISAAGHSAAINHHIALLFNKVRDDDDS